MIFCTPCRTAFISHPPPAAMIKSTVANSLSKAIKPLSSFQTLLPSPSSSPHSRSHPVSNHSRPHIINCKQKSKLQSSSSAATSQRPASNHQTINQSIDHQILNQPLNKSTNHQTINLAIQTNQRIDQKINQQINTQSSIWVSSIAWQPSAAWLHQKPLIKNLKLYHHQNLNNNKNQKKKKNNKHDSVQQSLECFDTSTTKNYASSATDTTSKGAIAAHAHKQRAGKYQQRRSQVRRTGKSSRIWSHCVVLNGRSGDSA
ncbi:hypothetical protein MPH_03586 [Macrophomina phaseolina MS6]|uniref:Uncharacterized protein n=1 Tax=Macrophomina phaseolina (strain MS6) TaxID=1126212 RepID=K2R9P1_MACPH|nr:hypothetical protein MPH_03586 [Macrophomina phaseolina MS6]